MQRIALWFLVLACLPPLHAATPDRPNIILILCDNLGYGDIEPFGSKLNRTPQLNRLAREGMKLTDFYVTSGVCTPSRASIMTGCYPQRIGLARIAEDLHVLRPVSPRGLNPAEVTLAEVLKPAGYATGLLGKWHLGDQPEFLPTRQGFDSYLGIPYSDDMTEREWNGRPWPPLPLMRDETVIEAPVDRTQLTRRYTEEALKFIQANRERPFFLFLSHAMPGSTKEPFSSEAFRGKSANGPWGDSVEEIDWSTGQILDQLQALNLRERTLVIWTSDNGAPGAKGGSNGHLEGRGYTTCEGGMRVPALAWWPGRIPGGSECRDLASTLDFLPTFAALAGAELPPSRTIDGKDIRPLLFAEAGARSPHEAYYFYQGDQLQAVRSGPWKLYLPLETPVRHGRFKQGPTPPQLFNVAEDPGCARELSAAHPEEVAKLTKFAEAARKDLGDLDQPGAGQRLVGLVEHATPRRLPAP